MQINTTSFRLLLSILLVLSSSLIYGQDFFVLAKNEPLQNIIYKVKDKYQIQISANANLLKGCLVNTTQKHPSLELLLSDLLKQCNLSFIKRKEVFIIKKNQEKTINPNTYNYNFQIIDKLTKESLPYSNIQLNNSNSFSDLNGNIRFTSKKNMLHIKISHLAYYSLDTIIKHDNTKLFLTLLPKFISLESVEVATQKLPNQLVVGNEPGLIKVNHILAKQLPGNNNNSIFNVLRLQPGILASGEPSKDFLIRGAYKGQSQILFDGITVFNIASFDDRVSVFNPLVVKNIQVYKSGYQVEIGDRVGGIVDVLGKNGSIEKQNLGVNISNQALGAYVNIPIKEKSNLQIAARNVYPDIFKPKFYEENNQFLNNLFTDVNLKFVSHFKNSDIFKLSVLGQRNSIIEKETEENNLRKYNLERNTIQYQAGASAQYTKHWKKAGNINFLAAFSMLNTNTDNNINYLEKLNVNNSLTEKNNIENAVSEFSFKINHQLPSTKFQDIKLGLAYIYNQTNYEQDSTGFIVKNSEKSLSRINLFAKDNISITKYLNIIAGLKIDYAIGDQLPFFQPRIQAIIKLNKHWKINAAYGIYNQFLEESTFLDRLNNRIYYWDIQNSKGNRRLGSMHYVLGLSAAYKYISFSTEAYYKNTYNFDQITLNKQFGKIYFQEIEARTYGTDFYLKGQYKRHTLWFAYTLSKTEEKSLKNDLYYNSDQDQRHEFKSALILNFKPFTFSTNYVFGSGFLNLGTYNRLDLALAYKKKIKNIKLEVGASVLNITNTKNIRYSNFSNFPNNKTIYSSALGITPNLFVNLSF